MKPFVFFFLFLLYPNLSSSMSINTAINNYFIGSTIDSIEGVWRLKLNSKPYVIKIVGVNKYHIYDISSETVWGEIVDMSNKWIGTCTLEVSEKNNRFEPQKFTNEDLEIYMITKNLLETRCSYSIFIKGQGASGVVSSKFERIWPKNIDKYNMSILKKHPTIDLKSTNSKERKKPSTIKNILGKLLGR